MTTPIEPKLFDLRMPDNSRHFAELPEGSSQGAPQWDLIRAHVALLPGAHLTSFVTDHVTEAWIDFEYGSHRFSLNNQQGMWWMFVADPSCPVPVLTQVFNHFERVLNPGVAFARQFGTIAADRFRCVVLEADGRISHADYQNFEAALRHADDAASETEAGIVLSYVIDAALKVVHRGQRY